MTSAGDATAPDAALNSIIHETPAPPEDDLLLPLLEAPTDSDYDSDDTLPPLLDEHDEPAPPTGDWEAG